MYTEKTERRYQTVSDLIADLKKSLVMPEEDFVKIAPMYAQQTEQPQNSSDEEDDIEDDYLNDDDDDLMNMDF